MTKVMGAHPSIIVPPFKTVRLFIYIPELLFMKAEIKATENGPYLVLIDGNVSTALCRCGQSSNKPYCDGTHKKVNFKANAAEVNLTQ